jgi:hypothetical protein
MQPGGCRPSSAEEEKHYWQYLSKMKFAEHLKVVLR